jgi:hypothetical protein
LLLADVLVVALLLVLVGLLVLGLLLLPPLDAIATTTAITTKMLKHPIAPRWCACFCTPVGSLAPQCGHALASVLTISLHSRHGFRAISHTIAASVQITPRDITESIEMPFRNEDAIGLVLVVWLVRYRIKFSQPGGSQITACTCSAFQLKE